MFGVAGDSTSAPSTVEIQSTVHECPTTTAEERAEVERLFEAPPTDSLGQGSDSNQVFQQRRSDIGRKYGVTIPDSTLQDELEKLDTKSKPFSYFFKATHDFLAEYGVDLSVARPGELGLQDNQIPTEADLETPAARYETRQISQGFSELPIEYFAAAGLKQIVLAKNSDDYAHAHLGNLHGIVVLNISLQHPDTGIGPHEVTHEMDEVNCGSPEAMMNDPEYAALNGGMDIYDPANYSKVITYEGKIWEDVNKLIDEQHSTDRAQACADQRTLNQDMQKVVAQSETPDIVEEKAEMGKNIAFPQSYGYTLDKNMPVYRQKFLLLMTRLYKRAPNVVRFLAAASSRTYSSDKDGFVQNC